MKLLLAGIVATAAVASAAPAGADPNDPHIPNWSAGWCSGGGSIRTGVTAFPDQTFSGLQGYCDGEPYPDGSYFHQVPNNVGLSGFGSTIVTTCRVNHGSMFSPPAPPGGCDGAA